MQRRRFLHHALLGGGLLLAGPIGCRSASDPVPGAGAEAGAEADFPPIDLTRAQWRELLSVERYDILFNAATEAPHSSPLDKQYAEGSYLCAACLLPLFDSADKYDSGTGWPSFTQPIAGRVGTKPDYKLLLPRTEYHCRRCGGHQGHVFDDGPPPTGQRWCNNGLALRFVPAGEPLPPLRKL